MSKRTNPVAWRLAPRLMAVLIFFFIVALGISAAWLVPVRPAPEPETRVARAILTFLGGGLGGIVAFIVTGIYWNWTKQRWTAVREGFGCLGYLVLVLGGGIGGSLLGPAHDPGISLFAGLLGAGAGLIVATLWLTRRSSGTRR